MNAILKKTFALFTAAMTAGILAVSPFTVSAEQGINGDTNGDGKIDLLDVINVCKHVINAIELTGTNFEQADCNKDGKVDLLDAIYIARRIICDKKIEELTSLINKERQKSGIEPLTINMALVDASMKRASELPKKFSWEFRPDDSEFVTVLDEYSIDYVKCGSCVVGGSSTAKEVFNLIMDNDSKKSMVLDAEYTEIGVGYYSKNDKYKNYWAVLII